MLDCHVPRGENTQYVADKPFSTSDAFPAHCHSGRGGRAARAGNQPPRRVASVRGRDRLACQGLESQSRHLYFPFRRAGQNDSFDMKPDAPENIRGEFKPIATRTRGIQICEHLPHAGSSAAITWALVRSLAHPYSIHSTGHMSCSAGRTEPPTGFA